MASVFIMEWDKRLNAGSNSARLEARLPFTGADRNNYREQKAGSLSLPKGEVTIAAMASVSDEEKWVMNLRELKLVLQK